MHEEPLGPSCEVAQTSYRVNRGFYTLKANLTRAFLGSMEGTDPEWGDFCPNDIFSDQQLVDCDDHFFDGFGIGGFGLYQPEDAIQAGDGPCSTIDAYQFFGQHDQCDAQSYTPYDLGFGNSYVQGHSEEPYCEANHDPVLPMGTEESGSFL